MIRPGDNLVSMLLKPSYTTQESEKVRVQKMLKNHNKNTTIPRMPKNVPVIKVKDQVEKKQMLLLEFAFQKIDASL